MALEDRDRKVCYHHILSSVASLGGGYFGFSSDSGANGPESLQESSTSLQLVHMTELAGRTGDLAGAKQAAL